MDYIDDYKTYSVEIKNNGRIDLFFVDLFLSYPIKQKNGWKGNPYKVEGKTEAGKPINIQPEQTTYFTIIAPIKEVFGDSDLLEIDHPYLELYGYTRNGGNYIPFGKTIGL